MPETRIKDQASGLVSKAKRRIGVERPLAAEEGGRTGIVRGALRAFGDGDFDRFLDALKDDAPFECPGGDRFPGSGDHEGPDEVKRTFIADAGRTYSEFGFEPETYVEADSDNAVIVFGRFAGQAVDGKPVDARAVQVWEFSGNTVEAVRIYADSADFPEVVTEEDDRDEAEDDEDSDQDDDQ